jgi:hypothetical protein
MTFATDEKLSISYPSFYLQSSFEEFVRKVWLVVIIGYSFSDPYVNQIDSAVSIEPTITIFGSPYPVSTSTSMMTPSRPITAHENTRARIEIM